MQDERTREIFDLKAKIAALTEENEDLQAAKTAEEAIALNLNTDTKNVEEQALKNFKSPSEMPRTSALLKGMTSIMHSPISFTRKKTEDFERSALVWANSSTIIFANIGTFLIRGS